MEVEIIEEETTLRVEVKDKGCVVDCVWFRFRELKGYRYWHYRTAPDTYMFEFNVDGKLFGLELPIGDTLKIEETIKRRVWI